ncbi:Lecithin:cholesterol acyltransferase family protein [Histomonas meleagridis]|uniref:Lecithin:cholesterol acyltransferase family protein n=1 Tax=Histomonas meleagridis TaxID=135588 RepID=UPI00355A18D1|nr:Lecithin:cholesterol acyltransferase family protein [Histomonas meleagridis]KAH0796165.1 Lecithin:cholesterol acyltransferase family protein [Histomonas meleagridis]
MLSFLFGLSQSLKPVIIIPGHFGSKLRVTTTRKPFWYCPSKLDNAYSWIRVRDLFPPYINCLLDYLTLEYDNETHKLKSRPNTTITTENFGNLSGIRGVGPEYLGRYLPVNYEQFILQFEQSGYQESRDLFAAPYDWRYGLEQPESFFQQLTALIEKAHDMNNSPVAFIAHGLGAALLHLYLTEKTTSEWRSKYIDSATYISPSFTGSGQAFYALWRLRFPYIHIRFDTLRRFVASLGAFHAHMPNSVAFSNSTLLIDPDGRAYNGSELIDFLKEHGRLTPEEIELAEQNFKHSRTLPLTPDFTLNILYNSGIKTPMGLKLRTWDDVGTPIYGHGDSLMGSKVVEWACGKWAKESEKNVRCHDVLIDDRLYYHRYLIKSPEIAKLVKRWILDASLDKVNEFSDEL